MLNRWDPFREMMTMRHAMDRLMENAITEEPAPADWSLALDVLENEGGYVVKASVPGVKPEDIEITFNKGMLTIRGEMKEESETNKGQYHLRERRLGTFTRTLALPTGVKADEINASYNDGVLTLRLPKAEEVKPKRITVTNGAKVIDNKG
jgi:HSP20 family protein